MHFNYVNFNRLRNNSFLEAFSRICERFEGEEFEVEDVTQAFEIFKKNLEYLVNLTNKRRHHPLTDEIVALKQKRHDALLSFKGRIAKCMKSPVKSEQEAGKRLNKWIADFKLFFSHSTFDQQNSMIKMVKIDFAKRPSLLEDFESVNLQQTWNEVQSISNQMNELFTRREKDRLEDTTKALEFRKKVCDDMDTFVSSIKQAVKLSKGDKDVLIGYLNTIDAALSTFRVDLSYKSTRRKNIALADKEKETEDAQGGETPVTPLMKLETGGNGNGDVNQGVTAGEGLLRMIPTATQPENVVTLHNDDAMKQTDKSQ